MSNKLLEALDAICGSSENYPTLKAIAAAIGVPQRRIYTVAKQPKEGEVYDANVYNWDAINRFVTRRLDPDKGIPTHEEVIYRAIELDKEFKNNDRRKGTRAGTAAAVSLGNGRSVPGRKFALELGQKVMLRNDTLPLIYTVAMMSASHVVLTMEDSPEISCYSNWTVNQKFIVDESRFEAICAERVSKMDAPADAAPTDESAAE